jgi:hypothetical protein
MIGSDLILIQINLIRSDQIRSDQIRSDQIRSEKNIIIQHSIFDFRF